MTVADALPVERPIVFTPPLRPARATPLARAIAGGVALACLTVLVVAAYLAPDPAGVGTTARMGLEPCNFLRATGLPCAGCGLTTAFNHAVRWEVAQALWAQPLGLLLAVLAAVSVWVGGYIAVTGRPAHRLIARGVAGKGVTVIVACVTIGLAAWGWKLLVMIAGIPSP